MNWLWDLISWISFLESFNKKLISKHSRGKKKEDKSTIINQHNSSERRKEKVKSSKDSPESPKSIASILSVYPESDAYSDISQINKMSQWRERDRKRMDDNVRSINRRKITEFFTNRIRTISNAIDRSISYRDGCAIFLLLIRNCQSSVKIGENLFNIFFDQ